MSKKKKSHGKPKKKAKDAAGVRVGRWRIDDVDITVRYTGKGYDLRMIQDFLDQLLLEVRAQHAENSAILRTLDETGDIDMAAEAAGELSAETLENAGQFEQFYDRYRTGLVAANVIDDEGATDEESVAFRKKFLEENVRKREEQIVHLEGLQELFAEAFMCARLPFGQTAVGFIQKTLVHRVREDEDATDGTGLFDYADAVDVAANPKPVADEALPAYGELLPQFEGHYLTTKKGVRRLKKYEVIVAVNEAFERPVLLYGLAAARRMAEDRKKIEMLTIYVESYDELRFVIAAILKHVGRPDTDGTQVREMFDSGR